MNSTNLNSPFIKYGCEIVKYQPQYYKDRVYTKNEWISVSDIGRSFDGEVLTKEEYLRVESAYVDTVKELLEVSGVKFLTIVEPNTFYWRRSKAFNKENKAIYQIVSSMKGATYSIFQDRYGFESLFEGIVLVCISERG